MPWLPFFGIGGSVRSWRGGESGGGLGFGRLPQTTLPLLLGVMNRTRVKEVLAARSALPDVRIQGWVRTRRDAKGFSFLEVNDGSSRASLQVVVDDACPEFSRIGRYTTGSAVDIRGSLTPSRGKGQAWELRAQTMELVGAADESYPLQKKRHSLEYLREIAHLRPRSNLFGAVFRVRSRLAFAVHQFFQERGFLYVHTPIITGSDCEGAGELFRITSENGEEASTGKGAADRTEEFFGRPTYLTVSGQLEAEVFACSHGNVYTFGPTFRAENSNTSRHASEFWMVEPEVAFADLRDNMDLAEAFVKALIHDTIQHSGDDLQFFNQFVDQTLMDRLTQVVEKPFVRLDYSEAIRILEASGESFTWPVEWGVNLQSEHERYLAERHFQGPVIIYNYPKETKPFYMRSNDDGRTVAAMDVLVPGIGEIIGGSQREERLEILESNLAHHNLNPADYGWYRDLRRYGSVPHAGFGLGFERMLMFLTGVANIRDVIPFPRTPGNASF